MNRSLFTSQVLAAMISLVATLNLSAGTLGDLPLENSVDQLAEQFYEQVWIENDFEASRRTAKKMLEIGNSTQNNHLKARGLVRLAAIELIFGRWGENWDKKFEKSEKLTRDSHDIARAEYLMFHGYIQGKFIPGEVENGISSIQEAIGIANCVRANTHQAVGYALSGELQLFTSNHSGLLRDSFRAEAIAKNVNSDAVRVIALRQLFRAMDLSGLDRSAEETAEEILKIMPDYYAQCHLFVAGKLPEFEQQLWKRVNYFRNIENRAGIQAHQLADALFYLCRGYMAQGRLAEARPLADEMISCYEEAQDQDSLAIARSISNSIDLALNPKNPEKMAELKRFLENHSDHIVNGTTSRMAAKTLADSGDFEDAYKWLERSTISLEKRYAEGALQARQDAESFWRAERIARKLFDEAKEKEIRSSRTFWMFISAGSLFGVIFAAGLVGLVWVKRERNRLEVLVQERTELLTTAVQDAEQANQAKSLFLAQVNHEIRNPLAAIMGYVSILDSDKNASSKNTRPAIEGLTSSSEHLLELVEGVLEMSTIEKGLFQEQNVEFSLEQLAEEVRTLFQKRAEEKQLTFRCQILSETNNAKIIASQTALRHIVNNLVSNAIKFTDQGFVELTFEAKPENKPLKDPEKITLEIVVADTGIGIPEPEQNSVFEQFNKSSNNDSFPGNGLGLSICKQLVERLEGTINLSSQLGRGTTVTARIPVNVSTTLDPDRPDSGIRRIDSGPSMPSPKNPQRPIKANIEEPAKFLLVDDQQAILSVLKLQIESLGYSCESTTDPEKTIEIVKTWRPDILLLDLRMPGKNGFQVLEMVREIQPNKLFVVAMTGDATQEVKEACIQSGFDAFLTKPFRMNELKDLLNSLHPAFDASVKPLN